LARSTPPGRRSQVADFKVHLGAILGIYKRPLQTPKQGWFPPVEGVRLACNSFSHTYSQENQIEDVRFLFAPSTTPPLWPPKLEYNAVSAERSMKFGNIVQGENLTIFDKDRDTAKLRKVDCEQRRLLRLLCTVGGNLAKLNARTESVFRQRGGGKLVVHKTVSLKLGQYCRKLRECSPRH